MTFLKKILLVDHEPGASDLLRHALEGTGKYLIKIEHDSRHVAQAAHWLLPDLILFYGTEAEWESRNESHQLRSDPSLKETPFLFLSANADSEKKLQTGGSISGYNFFAAAVTLDDLVGYVAEMLNLAPSSSAGTTR